MYLGTFNWVGGKSKKLGWLVPLLEPPGITSFVDAFGGSAVVLLNRKKAKLEVYNDLDSRAVNFFRVLRDRHEELFQLLRCTPYAKEEFVLCKEESEDPLEDARRFFCSISMSYSGTRTTFGHGTTSREGVPTPVEAHGFRVERLEKTPIVKRLMDVEIWHRPAIEVIGKFKEKEECLIYLDPPYDPSTWKTEHTKYHTPQLSQEDHKEMLAELVEAQC